MYYIVTLQTAPEDALTYFKTSAKTRLEGVARHHLTRWCETFNLSIDIDEMMAAPAKMTVFMPGGFPWVEIEKVEG